jgi:hypothetical protein
MTFTFTETIAPDSTVIRVDASLLKKSFCQTAFSFTLKGLRTKAINESYALGTSVHLFISKQREDMLGALKAATDYAKSTAVDERLVVGLCSAYPSNLLPAPAVIFGKSAEEFYFEVPWLETVVAGKRYTILVCGTMDHLSFTNDTLRVFDYKTTKKWKSEEALAGYNNDVQFIFYPWVLWKFAYNIFSDKTMADAARSLKITSTPVIGHLTTKPAKWKVGDAKSFTEEVFADFEMELRDLLSRMLLPILSDESPNRDGWIKNLCPRCDYNVLCHARTEMYDVIKDKLFLTRTHDPRQHGKNTTEK